MATKSLRLAAILLAGFIAFAVNNTAQAAYKLLGDSGWAVSWVGSADPYLSVREEAGGVTSTSVIVEKVAHFTTADVSPLGIIDPKIVVFQQVSRDAKPLVIINDETITNDTGLAWTGFRMSIMDGTTGTTADSRFDPVNTAIGLPNGFSIDPFTAATYSDNNQVLDISGGTIPGTPPGNIWFPGQTSGQLYINAVPTSSGAFKTFVLKEQPVIAIPLPAAAWSGLSGIVALGLLGAAKKVRALVA